eukprot:4854666-Lingulodinium_polyedra.AAC.1
MPSGDRAEAQVAGCEFAGHVGPGSTRPCTAGARVCFARAIGETVCRAGQRPFRAVGECGPAY